MQLCNDAMATSPTSSSAETLSIKEFYDAFAEYYDQFYDPIDYQSWAETLQHHLDELLPGPRRILDAGCGTGGLLQKLSALPNNHCLGIDCSSAMLQACREKISNSVPVDLVQGDLLASCFQSESFDAVLGAFSLLNAYSAAGRRALLAEVLRVLKPNGIFLSDFFTIHRYAQLRQAAEHGEQTGHDDAEFQLQQTLLPDTNWTLANAGEQRDHHMLERKLSLRREGMPPSESLTQRLYFLEPEEIGLDFLATGFIIIIVTPLVRDSRSDAPNRLMLIGRKPCPSSISKSSTTA